MHLNHLTKKEWEKLSEQAHLISFGETGRADLDRVDFAILAVDEQNQPAGYFTFYEHDKETLYMQHGGAFPNYAKSVHVYKGYSKVIDWARSKYKFVTTKIENTNAPMLKLAAKAGFKIVGVSNFKNKILLDHLLGG